MTIEEIIKRLEDLYNHYKVMASENLDMDHCKDAMALDYALMVVKRDLKARQLNRSQENIY